MATSRFRDQPRARPQPPQIFRSSSPGNFFIVRSCLRNAKVPLLSCIGSRAGLVTSRQTFVRRWIPRSGRLSATHRSRAAWCDRCCVNRAAGYRLEKSRQRLLDLGQFDNHCQQERCGQDHRSGQLYREPIWMTHCEVPKLATTSHFRILQHRGRTGGHVVARRLARERRLLMKSHHNHCDRDRHDQDRQHDTGGKT